MNPQLYDDCVHFCWKCKKVGMLLDIGDQWESTMTHKDCGGLIGKWRTVSKAKYVGWSWEEKEKFHAVSLSVGKDSTVQYSYAFAYDRKGNAH